MAELASAAPRGDGHPHRDDALPMPAAGHVDISIVIACRDQTELLLRCLASIERQIDPPSFEVVVVDDGSTTALAPIIHDRIGGWSMPVRVVSETALGIAAARNHGIDEAVGDVIVITDADCELHPDLLARVGRALEDHPDEVAFQLELRGGDASTPERAEHAKLTTLLEVLRVGREHVRYLNTSGIALRRDDTGAFPRFDPGYERASDTELLSRLQSRSGLPRLIEGAVVVHRPPQSTFRYISRQVAIGYRTGPARNRLKSRSEILLTERERAGSIRTLVRRTRSTTRPISTFATVGTGLLAERAGRAVHRLVRPQPGRFPLLSVVLDPVDHRELVAHLVAAPGAAGSTVTYVSAWTIVQAERDPRFSGEIEQFDTVYADGMGAVLLAGILHGRRTHKLTSDDLLPQLLEEWERRGRRIAFVGGTSRACRRATATLRAMQPGLDIAFSRSGFLDHNDEHDLADSLNAAGVDVVILAMGQPRQERLALRLRAGNPGLVVWCVGGLVDLLAGTRRPAPRLIRRTGFEWAFRLITQPRVVWVRYVVGLPELAWLAFRAGVTGAVGRRHDPN